MNRIKMLALAVMAVSACTASVDSASAAVLTSPQGTHYTGELNFTRDSSLLIKAGFANITCIDSTITGKVESNTTVATGKITNFTFSFCGSSTAFAYLLADGSYGTFRISSGGAVSAAGFEITVGISSLGTSCIYGGKTGTKLGTLHSGSTTTDATLTLAAELPLIKTASGFGCASPASWSGSYWATKPTPLIVD